MTDFLSNLLMRSTVDQPRTTILQPRLPSLFEPQHRPEQSRPGGLDEITQETIPPAPQSASTWIPANDLPDGPFTLTQAKEPLTGLDVPPSLVTPKSITAGTTLDARRDPNQPRPVVPPVSFLEEPQQTILPRTDDMPSVEKHRMQETSTLISENAVQSSGIKHLPMDEKQMNAPRTGKSLPKEDLEMEKTIPSPVNALPMQSRLKSVVLPQPLPTPFRFGEKQQFGQIQASESQQVIEIHIGRIEVRAVPPATSGKRSSQPAAKTSLDDYLRARSGDKR
jgi:hypothetical protein